MLITILGGLGSGKTLLMVIFAYYLNRKIVTNFKLNIENREIEEFNKDKFLRTEYSDCIILLDEAYTYLESRISGSDLNKNMSYILFQSRKKNVELYITAQLFSSLDKRYRELSDIFIIANRIDLDFSYSIIMKNNPNKVNTLFLEFPKVLPFFELYDTNEVIKTTNQKLLFEIQEPEEKGNEIEDYANEIKEFYFNEGYEKVTKNMIDLYITKHNNIPKFLSNPIFTIIGLEKKQNRMNEKKSKKVTKKVK